MPASSHLHVPVHAAAIMHVLQCLQNLLHDGRDRLPVIDALHSGSAVNLSLQALLLRTLK